ncbi:MAG: hypothetical protein ABIB43_05910 [archaeon]
MKISTNKTILIKKMKLYHKILIVSAIATAASVYNLGDVEIPPLVQEANELETVIENNYQFNVKKLDDKTMAEIKENQSQTNNAIVKLDDLRNNPEYQTQLEESNKANNKNQIIWGLASLISCIAVGHSGLKRDTYITKIKERNE